MKLICPNFNCTLGSLNGPKTRSIVHYGSFYRKSDSRKILRYRCQNCLKTFSKSTNHPLYFQKKRRITHPLTLLLNSGVSQRRAAMILKVNPKTVVRRFRIIADVERAKHRLWLKEFYSQNKLSYIQFDDLETAEHTKCKPLSVALAVDPKSRKILDFQVNQMPAKGLLARVAVRKYGYRSDERPKGWNSLMESLKPIVHSKLSLHSDENPHYVQFVKKHFPLATHEQVKGGRGAVTGQGELKKLKFDPLFALNHTCAMLRANLNRLFRRTWCITKNRQGLIDHLSLYVSYHNRVLTYQQG